MLIGTMTGLEFELYSHFISVHQIVVVVSLALIGTMPVTINSSSSFFGLLTCLLTIGVVLLLLQVTGSTSTGVLCCFCRSRVVLAK